MEVRSREFQRVVELAERVAKFDSSVLITGETGVGKEIVARHIHSQSPRSDAPFVAINCGALPESLLESTLFGHKAGAFTGATKDQPGLFEEAEKGTIFLDEIGDTTPAMQLKLLRVLQEREIMRVGETRPRKVDVRVISATNHDLQQAVHDNSFREDLYYRLRVVEIEVPPLRQRKDDILPLAGISSRSAPLTWDCRPSVWTPPAWIASWSILARQRSGIGKRRGTCRRLLPRQRDPAQALPFATSWENANPGKSGKRPTRPNVPWRMSNGTISSGSCRRSTATGRSGENSRHRRGHALSASARVPARARVLIRLRKYENRRPRHRQTNPMTVPLARVLPPEPFSWVEVPSLPIFSRYGARRVLAVQTLLPLRVLCLPRPVRRPLPRAR